MTLPLLERARADGVTFVYTPRVPRTPQGLVQIEEPRSAPLIPNRSPAAGEQYRFHFDMTKCIGCKCCVVACNEQNGNPAAIQWRKVGEIEGGYYPYTQRFHLSMGCNHCVEPSCLHGCPVEAYTKDPGTGVVLHDADTCIGCQYCTWNCSYGVPQYNPERGVVGKCDLCHNRLADGQAPACASACPEGAIAIEIVSIADWRQNYSEADAPGMPPAHVSISTTRITKPANLLPDTGRVDTGLVELEDPHWPLVFMLVLTQLSVGAFAVLWLLDWLEGAKGLAISALAPLTVAGLSLGASTLHLGRPIYAWRALRGLGHSWLSREVLGLGLFAKCAAAFAGMLFFDLPGREAAGALTVLSGIAGIFCSARIYLVPARPAWNESYTPAEFFFTALLLGPLFVASMGVTTAWWPIGIAVVAAAAQLVNQLLKFLWLSRSDHFEPKATAMLLSTRLRRHFLARLGLLLGGIGVALVVDTYWSIPAGLALALAGELVGRWLFFVSVVPRKVGAAFTGTRKEAA